jgi:hypothetical protein
VPSSLAKELTRGGDLLLRQPPYRAGTAITFRAIWHGRNDYDPAHVWLQESIARVAQQVA